MFWLALILAVLSAACFFAAACGARVRLRLVDIGLFLFVVAWILQIVWTGGGRITIH